jgi:hypothetical protein
MTTATAKKVVLVPWDFSNESEIALKHALQLADVAGNDILLLHIIPSSWLNALFGRQVVGSEELDALKRKIEAVADKVSPENGITTMSMVLEGNPVKIVRDLITPANLNLIVANKTYTHNKKKYNTSHFVKKLSVKSLSIPFVIAESAPVHNHYIEIVVPLDSDKKYKEILHWIIYLSKYYKCNINLIKPYISDEGKKKDMANNIYFTKKMLDGNKIVYGIKTAKRQNDFSTEVFKFAGNIDADLILIMADKYNTFVNSQKGKGTVKIPIMCITPRIRKLQGFH